MSSIGIADEPIVPRLPPLAILARRSADRAIEFVLGNAPPGSVRRRGLDQATRLPIIEIGAYLLYVWLLLGTVDILAHRSPLYLLALLGIPAGWLMRHRPVALGMVIAVTTIWVRVLYLGTPETCDQLAVSRAALNVALHGGNPYGIGYAQSVPPGSPFPYGPLGLVTAILGQPGETVAFAAVALILARQRALFTLAFLGAYFRWVDLGACGMNDMLPALFLLGGLLLVERRRYVAGPILVAISAGIKPYSFAWFPGLMGLGGVAVAAVLLVAAGIFWLPVVIWGARDYLTSVQGAWVVQHRQPQNTVNMPWLRFLGPPLAVFSLFVRSWEGMVLSGALIFMLMMFTDYWMSLGYWMVVLPPLGIVLERALRGFSNALAEAVQEEALPMGAPALA